jgi:predicted TIM-barrel fold metal-dependent hydrolase
MKDRAPRMENFPDGEAWVLEGVADPINFGLNACAGLPDSEMRGWKRFSDVRRGGYDPVARITEMAQDGVDAEVLYPTPRLAQGIFANPDPKYHVTMIQAYNDWISEYVEHAPARFGGLMLLPNCGVEAAVSEVTRVWGRPGIRGVVMGCYPNGSLDILPEDDKLWDTLANAGITLGIHVSLNNTMPSAHRASLPGAGRFYDAPNRIVQLIFAGVFDRYPTLRLTIAEVDFGWVPYFKEQIDNNYRRLAGSSNFSVTENPSTYVERHVHFTYMTDNYGIRNRQEVGVDRILWSSDYPHVSADWPHSWRTINASLSGIPAAERQAILVGNAARLYGVPN